MEKIFLGGTCPGWDWRKELIKLLNINYYNHIVPCWNETVKKNRIARKRKM